MSTLARSFNPAGRDPTVTRVASLARSASIRPDCALVHYLLTGSLSGCESPLNASGGDATGYWLSALRAEGFSEGIQLAGKCSDPKLCLPDGI